ncbi:MAG: prepilin peptidase [Planctomycetota bacterium]
MWISLPDSVVRSDFADVAGVALREDVVMLSKRSIRFSWQTALVALVLGGLLVYMILVPAAEAILDAFKERPTSYTIEDLTLLEQLRIRSSKLAIFGIFTYVGACWGSFLNVAAYGVPRREKIALRSSACPKCGNLIRRIDNLPIISYLALGGACRYCKAKIPVRYLIVEIVGAVIFGSMFLYELVTGAANVPGFRHYSYTGILWIILYTKWPVVGIYFYHAALMCVLLLLALMDWDRRRYPAWFGWVLLAVFAVLPIAAPALQPFTSFLSSGIPDVALRVLTVALGGGLGLAVGWTVRRYAKLGKRGGAIPLAMTLLGVALGWKALVTIAALWGLLLCIGYALHRQRRWERSFEPTAALLAAALLHHPFWKILAGFW